MLSIDYQDFDNLDAEILCQRSRDEVGHHLGPQESAVYDCDSLRAPNGPMLPSPHGQLEVCIGALDLKTRHLKSLTQICAGPHGCPHLPPLMIVFHRDDEPRHLVFVGTACESRPVLPHDLPKERHSSNIVQAHKAAT